MQFFLFLAFFHQHFYSKQLHQLLFPSIKPFCCSHIFFSQSSFYNFFPYFDRVAYQFYLFIITAILHLQLIFENWYQCILCSLFCYLIPSSKALTVLVNRFAANYSKHFYISTGISSGPTAFSFFNYCIAVQTYFSVISFTFWIYSSPIPVFSFIFVQEFSPSFENIFFLCWHSLSPKHVAHFSN